VVRPCRASAGAAVLVALAVGLSPAGATADEPPAGSGAADDAPADAPAGDDIDKGRRSSLTRDLAEKGEADLHRSVRVFQQLYMPKAGRVEVMFGAGLSLADPMIKHYSTDATLLVHLGERWAIGVGGSRWAGWEAEQFNMIERDFGLFPERSMLQAGGHGQLQWSPLVGKFASFGIAVLQVDGYLLAGGGVARTSRSDALKPFGLVGVGLRVHTARWLTLAVEFRDMIMSEQFISESKLLQHVFAGIQLGVWLPPSVSYKFPR